MLSAWFFFDAILKLMSGLLIVYSLLLFKGFVKKMRQSNADFFASERLMTVHFAVFVLVIIANFGICINITIAFALDNRRLNDGFSFYCRY